MADLTVQPVAQPQLTSVGQVGSQKPITPAGASSSSSIADPNKPLDQKAVNLAKAIRQVESSGDPNAVGDQGTSHGAYQFHNDNFQRWAKIYGVDGNDFSLENQNKLAYLRIKDFKDKGLQPDEIAAIWNGADYVNGKYIAKNPTYVQKVKSAYDQISNSSSGYLPVSPVTQEEPPSVVDTGHPFNPKNTNSQFVDPNTPSPDTGVLHNLAKVTGFSKDSFAPIPNPLDIPKNIAKPFAAVGGSIYRQAQSLPQEFQGDYAGANQTAATPINLPWLGKINTVQGNSNLQNVGLAAQLASDVVGAKGELPAITNNQVVNSGIQGMFQGGLSNEGTYLASNDRPSLKTPQGIMGAFTSGLGGTLTGGATGAAAAFTAPAFTGQSTLPALFKNKQSQIANEQTWQMVRDPKLEANTNKSTLTGTVADVTPTTQHDTDLVQAAKPYVIPENPIATKNNLQQAVGTKSQELETAVTGRGGTWSENNLSGAVKATKVPLAIKGTAEMTQVENLNNYVMELANDPEIGITRDAAGSLRLSKQFRQNVSSEFGENIWDKDTPIATYIKNLNKALNKFTAAHLPQGTLSNGTSFGDAMKQISLISEARDNVVIPKAGKQTSTNYLGKTSNLVKPIINKALPFGVGGEITKILP